MNKNSQRQIRDPLGGVVKCSPHEKLGSVLAKTKTNHEPVFVFEKNKYRGLVSPHYSLFYRHFPYETLASHCIIKPPYITSTASYFEIAQYMLETKLYTLPIVDENNQIESLIKINTLLQHILKQPEIFRYIVENISPSKPITASIHANVNEVFVLMRDKKIDNVVLINEKGKLTEIVTRRDIQDAFTAKTTRQRYVTIKNPPVHSSFDEEEVYRHDAPILEFVTQSVLSAPHSMPMELIIKRLIQSHRNSIVITQNDGVPVGFISLSDILKTFIQLKPEIDIQVTWTKHLNGLGKYRIMAVYNTIYTFIRKFNRRFPIKRVEIHIDQKKNAAGFQKKLFETTFHIFLKSGTVLRAKAQKWGLSISVKEGFNKLENEVDMSDRQKYNIKALKHF